MAVDFTPENNLEKAIKNRDNNAIICAIADGSKLSRLVSVCHLGYENFSDEAIYSVLLLALSEEQLKSMTSEYYYHNTEKTAAQRLKNIVNDALSPMKESPDDAEKALMKAIIFSENQEVIRLIKEENTVFYGFAVELLPAMADLSKEAKLTLLRDGISTKLKAVLLGIFLNEAEKPEIFNYMTYSERVKYANLMLRIMLHDVISAAENWFPENGENRFDYYFDPKHRFPPQD